MMDQRPSADMLADRIFNTLDRDPHSSSHKQYERAKNVIVVDRYRLSGECLARLIEDHCFDLKIRIIVFQRAEQVDFSAYAPVLIILNIQGQAFFHAEWSEWFECQTMVITRDAEAAPCDRIMPFPAGGDVGLLVAAVRMVLAGGQFIIPERSRRV